MVHSRFNQHEPNPNPHINFITALPAQDGEDARQYLRALAAQVRPVMKAHGFEINSLEEYEYNAVFAGRNWNNGETVELVLRRPGGSFLPSSWVLSTLAHELAHIKHMNHGPTFQALWQKLRNEVRKLQDRGYYGDGYWSAGTRLADSAVISGEGLDTGELPEYICGGAQNRTRPSGIRRRRGPRRPIEPSNKTGRQTAKQRKPGSRITSKYAFQGEGTSLNAGDSDSHGKGFGKQAGSKRAREERALAAERRLQALASSSTAPVESDEEENFSEGEIITETDDDRRKALLAAEGDKDLKNLNLQSSTSWKSFQNDFVFTGQGRAGVIPAAIDISSDSEEESSEATSTGKGKRKADVLEQQPKAKKTKSSLVDSEIAFRKKEALGMAPVRGKGHTIGGSTAGRAAAVDAVPSQKGREGYGEDLDKHAKRDIESTWSCLVCTLENEPLHLACAACGTERSQRLLSS